MALRLPSMFDNLKLPSYDCLDDEVFKCVMKWDRIEGDQRCIRNIIFPDRRQIRSGQFSIVARRSPKLRKLMLPPGTNNLSRVRVSTLLYSWKELEEFSIGPIENMGMDGVFRAMGSFCKNLTRLHIFGSFSSGKFLSPYFRLNLDNAWVIAENLLQLELFIMDKANIHKSGVQTLLSECKNLLDLNLIDCCRIIDPVAFLMKMKYIKEDITLEIKRCCMVRDCRRWSWSASSTDAIYAEDLVNQLWTKDVEIVENKV